MGIWGYILSMGAYLILLLFIIDIMRKHYKFAHWFWVGSLFTFPLWFYTGGVDGWFRWFKTMSMLVPIILLGLVRIANAEDKIGKGWSFIRKNWALWFFYGILCLNILEATIKDLQAGNYWNGLTGFLLIVTAPYAPKYWRLSKDKHSDLIAHTTIAWNFLYTTWNLAFVYGEAKQYFASSIIILAAAELYPILKKRPELYITARVYTLSTHLLIRALLPGLFPAVMNSITWMNADVLKYWGIINAILIIPYVFWFTWQLDTGKAEQSFKRIKKVAANVNSQVSENA